ncbi:MAG TPA: TadE/TadG family type IV pilus assembly protein [Actinomycetota bacterium]|nr:TadE/TadG family type IV pilus assembly protein [Actinomycetota bacterium]
MRHLRRDQLGQSTVEFALILPIVLVLVLGLVQIGLFMRDQLLVASAAREGAREAAVTPDRDRIARVARRAAPGLDLDVDVDRGLRRGDPARVRVSASPTRVPLVGQIVGGRRLRGEATMRVERE